MIDIYNINRTKELSERLSEVIIYPIVICLRGDLGSGKTTFAQFFIKNRLRAEVEVVSPTFSLVQTYNLTPPIKHFDLYRLKTLEEVYELGIEEDFENSISLIEWPELIEPILPPNRIEVEFSNQSESERFIEFKFFGDKAALKSSFFNRIS